VNQDLANTVADELMSFFDARQLPTRRALLDRIIVNHPHLNFPKLDLVLGMGLNDLVNSGTLQRVQGKFYAPGERFRSR